MTNLHPFASDDLGTRSPAIGGTQHLEVAPSRYAADACGEFVQDVVEVSCEHLGISSQDFYSKKRTYIVALGRQIVCVMLRVGPVGTPLSLPQIGRLLNRDHTSVLYSVWKMSKRFREKHYYEQRIEAAWRAVAAKGWAMRPFDAIKKDILDISRREYKPAAKAQEDRRMEIIALLRTKPMTRREMAEHLSIPLRSYLLHSGLRKMRAEGLLTIRNDTGRTLWVAV